MTPVYALCDDHLERAAAADPVEATAEGVSGHDAQATDYSPAGHDVRAGVARETLRRLDALVPQGPADELAAGYLRERLAATLAWYDAGEHLREVHVFGPLQSVRSSTELLSRSDPAGRAALLARVAAVPAMLAGQRETLQAGLATGTPAARRQVLGAIEQTATWAGRRAAPPAYHDLPGDLPGDDLPAAAAAHEAYGQMSDWLRETYLPQAATADGVGAQRYAVWSRLFLGAGLDAPEAYAWGWEELHRIEAEMVAEAERVLPGAGLPAAIAHLDATEVVPDADAYRDWLQDRHDRALADIAASVDVDPRLLRLDVRLAPAGSASAPYYTAPTEDLSRPGSTWWPAAGRTAYTTWDDVSTVFHEGVPGHHLQLGTAKVAELSRFARNSFVSGHGEGWALYAERYADELGWFATPGERLGMLLGSALRAARVVIDIGVHLGLPLPAAEAARHGERWTFDVAREVLRERGRLPVHQVDSEVLRYFGWPGQAPSYKLGERAWLGARERAQARLGPAFDLRAWHTYALSLGPLGLAALGDALDAWQPAAG